MSPRMRRFIPWVVVLLLALPACNEELDDEDRSNNILSAVDFSPLVGFSDVDDMGTEDDITTATNECEDGIFADLVTVTVDGDPRNDSAVTFPNDVVLTQYAVEFFPLDGLVLDADLPDDFIGTISQQIPSGSTTSFSIEIVRIQDKQGIFSLACRFGPTAGSCGPIGANCGTIRQSGVRVTFTGEDVAGKPVSLVGFMTIEFGDFSDGPGPNPGLLGQ